MAIMRKRVFWIIFSLMVLVPFSAAPMSSGLIVKAEEKEDKKAREEKEDELKEKLENMGLKRTEEVYQSLASWYGGRFHGKATASSEAFNKDMLCAAHKTLPLNTYLLVTNLENREQVIVRVNDRGPFIEGRDLDLSEAAAKVIGGYQRGIIPVEYEILYDNKDVARPL